MKEKFKKSESAEADLHLFLILKNTSAEIAHTIPLISTRGVTIHRKNSK